MPKIYTPLDRIEFSALSALAKTERRNPRDQAAWLIRESLVNRGLLQQQRLTESAKREVQND